MSTPKRERQRLNRSKRIAAAEEAAKKAARARRVKLIGALAVAVALVLGGLALMQRLGDDDNNATSTTEDDAAAEDDRSVADAGGDTDATDDPAAEPATDDPAAEPATDDPAAEPATGPAPPGCPATDGSSERVIDFDGPQPDCINPNADYAAVFNTSEGEMRFDLHAAEVPATVNNFVTLARWGYYDGTLLFRTDPSIDIIQGGSPHTNSASDRGPGYTISDEPAFETDPETDQLAGPYRYQPGQLVMARSAGPDSASAQFFLTAGPNASLLDSQGTYVVFGTTDDSGLAVAQSIMALHEPGGALGGAPSRDVTVLSVTIVETPPAG